MKTFAASTLALAAIMRVATAVSLPAQGMPTVDFVTTDAAVPANGTETGIQAREDGTHTYLYVCTDANWRGTCANIYAPYSTHCFNFEGDFVRSISSAGSTNTPDGGQCILFSDEDCQGDTLLWIYPGGYSNLADHGFNDQAESFNCGPYNGH